MSNEPPHFFAALQTGRASRELTFAARSLAHEPAAEARAGIGMPATTRSADHAVAQFGYIGVQLPL